MRILSIFFLFFFLPNSVSSRASTLVGDIAAQNPLPSPPPSQRLDATAPFRPGIAVLVAAVTSMFSLIFLLLLYTKHCKRATAAAAVTSHGFQTSSSRKNSGIDRAVVESLPVFRFSSLRGQKGGLECAVCLTAFDAAHILRLLPKCKHAFHVECIDTWLDAHSTCPLCRYRVDPEDILLIVEYPEPDPDTPARRVSGRHSSALEKTTPSLKPLDRTTSYRRSVDSLGIEEKAEIHITHPQSITTVGRKDGLLLTVGSFRKCSDRRLDHRIIISSKSEPRWSDMQAADLLYLQSEMILSGSIVDNGRSVSEITAVRRFSVSNRSSRHRERQAGLVSRWRAWVSSQSQPEARYFRATSAADLAAQPQDRC